MRNRHRFILKEAYRPPWFGVRHSDQYKQNYTNINRKMNSYIINLYRFYGLLFQTANNNNNTKKYKKQSIFLLIFGSFLSISTINIKMNNISLEQIATRIPKSIQNWDTTDIINWFKCNQIQIDADTLIKTNIDGDQFCNNTPQDWMRNFGCTRFIAKRIVQWVEDQAPQFQEIVAKQPQKKMSLSRQNNVGNELLLQEFSYDSVLPEENLTNKLMRNLSVETNNEKVGQLENNYEKQNSRALDNQFLNEVGKWDKPKISQSKNDHLDIGNQFVKFAKSQLQILERPYQKIEQEKGSLAKKKLINKKLKISYDNCQSIITDDCKIGRHRNSDINLTEESVSRHHAEIIAKKSYSGLVIQKFYFMDIGSRFGSYVPVRGKSQIENGNFYHLAENQIQIVSIIHKGKTFDLKIILNREEQIKFNNKISLSIGKKGDLKLWEQDSPSYRISMDKDRKSIYIEACEGILYQQLGTKQLWDIEQNMMPESRTSIILGSLKIQIELIKQCLSCSRNTCKC